MKYFKSSFKYFFDKGPYLVLISIIPSLMLPFLVSPSSSLYFLSMYKNVDATNFGTLFLQMRALPFEYFYIGIIGLVLAVLTVSILFGIIDRHMRVGDFNLTFSRAKTRINYNILTAIKFIALVALSFEFLNLTTTVFYYWWAVAFETSISWLVFSTITMLTTSFIFLIFVSITILWSPFMLHTGLKAKDSFKMAWRQITGKVISVALSIFVLVLPFQLVMMITGVLHCGVIVRTVLDGICYAFVIPFYITLMYTIFYDVTGTERMDLQKVDIWAKKKKSKKNDNIS